MALTMWLLSAVAVVSCGGPTPVQHDGFVAMDSFVEISVATARNTDNTFAAIRAEVARLDSLLSDYRADSSIGRLNAHLDVDLEPEVLELLRTAQRVCRETGGAFDISLKPVKELWGFGSAGGPALPDSLILQQKLRHVGCDVYRLSAAGDFEWLDAEARIDLGGIAQGLVTRRIGEILEAGGFDDYLVNVSGDILIGGERSPGRAWRIGVLHPRQPESLLLRLELSLPAVTTSGDYEQSFLYGGRRYHHIFDPATGYPVSGVASVSVFSKDAVHADCYATAVFVMGKDKGLEFVNARDDLEALIVVVGADDSVSTYRSSRFTARQP